MELIFRKSTYTKDACVEVADAQAAGIVVRDSKNPSGHQLRLNRSAFSALLRCL